MSLYSVLKDKVIGWRKGGYKSDFPVISEILDFNYSTDIENPKYLRKAQFEALETYWYLRIIENTPHIIDLYKKYFTRKELLEELGLKHLIERLSGDLITEEFVNNILNKINQDDEFVRQNQLETLRETLYIKYPSYILALAMGAGKTILIGTIIATEFVMALEYPQLEYFVKNALVFAPGKTILGALRELEDTPYEKILPPRLYKEFITTVKFTYTKDGEKDIPIIKESSYNIIVTNTEKIILRKDDVRRNLFQRGELATDDRKELIANRRLQTIASLPNLAVFSDEAHHTYGQALGTELKRVRRTVDHLSTKTNLIVVVNTTGTPYYGKQTLKDVIYWYGLSQGIQDGILKDVRGNIVSYEDVEDEHFIKDVIKDFFTNYKDVRIFDGSLAKLAMYFPNIDDLQTAKPIVERALLDNKIDPSVILEVHNESPDEIKDLFDNRINDNKLSYRVFLLVNKGTEGWNCLSLYATALARELKASNNFCLQAASRCLRQTPGNIHKAKIYLSKQNVSILDAQLRETYGETLQDLNRVKPNTQKERLKIRKLEIPPLVLKKKIQRIIPLEETINFDNINLTKPEIERETAKRVIYDLRDIPDRKGVLISQNEEAIQIEEDYIDAYVFAVEVSSLYRLPLMQIYEKICNFYPEKEIPQSHTIAIKKQLEDKIKNYKIIEEEIEQALALIHPQSFDKEIIDNQTVYTTEIIYHIDKAKLLWYDKFKEQNKWYQLDFGFHYTPYNFDSNPEKDLFEQLLVILNEKPEDIEDIYFTGAITDRDKTDFIFEYKGNDNKWHDYTPDFLIKKKDGKILIVEVKSERMRNDEIEGINGLKAMKMEEIKGLNPDKLKYEILFTDRDEIGIENVNKVKDSIYEYGEKDDGK